MVLAQAVLTLLLAAPANRFFEVEASFVPPAKVGAEGRVDVLFSPIDPDVQINEQPAVRFELEPTQVVLVARNKPAAPSEVEPGKPQYLDLSKPVSFPVAFAPSAPKGTWDLGAR